MQTWKRILARCGSLLNCLVPSAKPLDPGVAEIQRAMLEALTPATVYIDATIARRITQADDVQTLWYLRADLMAALAGCEGEVRATQTLRAISSQFEGLLPGRLSTRPSPLAHC